MDKETDKKLRAIIKIIEKVTFENVKKGEMILPSMFILEEENKLKQLALPFTNPMEKQIVKQLAKKFLLNSKLKGYVTVFDVKLTKAEKDGYDTGEVEVVDAILITSYTPKERYSIVYPYKDKKILKDKMIMKGRSGGLSGKNIKDGTIKDEWDIWGEGITDEDEEYKKFRRNNPSLYGDNDNNLDGEIDFENEKDDNET